MFRELKLLGLKALGDVGVMRRIAASRWRQERLLVLCYHGISLEDEHEWDPLLFVPAKLFEQRVETMLERGYTVLSLAEGLRRLRDGSLPPRSVTLTFDDGHHDFFAKAYPILKRFNLPATVYLTTYYSGFQRPVFDMVVSYILWKGGGRVFDLSGVIGNVGEVDLRSPDSRIRTFIQIRNAAREAKLAADAKDDLARKIAQRLGVDYDRILERRIVHLMNEEELRTIARDQIAIELHTHRHRMPREEAPFRDEIRQNRERIREIIGTDPSHFCYPSGIHAERFFPWMKAEGVATATTCEPGLATAGADPYLIPRVLDKADMTSVEFESWLSGVSSWIPIRGGAARPPA